MTSARHLNVLTAPNLPPLLAHLTESIRNAPLPPREHDVIVVQSQGMRRWLTLELADAFGCAGSLSLPFPAHFVRDVSQRLSPDRSVRDQGDPFSREALAWRLDAILQSLPAHDSVYQPLRTYLAGSDARARFGLATQIAGRLDDYQMYRADLLQEWEAGRDTPDTPHAAWQAALWRTLCADIGSDAPHLAEQLQRTIRALGRGAVAALPSRVAVFGVSSLPPLFIELLAAVARHVPVTVYSASLDPASPHPLAAMFGSQSREFMNALSSHDAQFTPIGGLAGAGTGLLHTLQHELSTSHAGNTPLAIATGDATFRVHDAHGEMRQLEILRDQLLAALADDPTLRPHDLLLLVPDAAEWAPLVDAVFGVAGDEAVRLPYRIADRPMRRTLPAAEALARLVALEGGRFARSEVFGLLAHPLIRQAAGLTEADVDALEELTARANVRWGYDAESRATLGLPAYEQASWRAGLDRLLLGVAVGRSDDLVLGLLVEAGDTAGDPETLATLATWVDSLASLLADWKTSRTLLEWTSTLASAIEAFFRAEAAGEQQQVVEVMNAVQRLPALAALSGNSGVVPFGVLRDWLEGELEGDGFGTGFLMGGMTIAALKPMRSLPFRVIAVAGLDDGVFPRRERRAAFDLLEHEQRPGDRDLRSDDRQLLLDLMLAAQDRLMLAYSGRAVSDNSACAPSVVIDEMLDHLDRRTDGRARRAVVVTHPLQPFSSTYFAPDRDPRLFTFSKAQARAARAGTRRGEGDIPFVTAAVKHSASTGGAPLELTLRDLTDCWTNPSKFYCKSVLRIALGDDAPDVSDDELFALNHMQQGSAKARILAAALNVNHDGARVQNRLLAGGDLPFGELGAASYGKLAGEVNEVLAHLPDLPSVAIAIELEGDGWRLKGRMDGIRGDRRYVVRAGKVRAEHRIRAWVEHVAMCAAREGGTAGLPEESVLVGIDGVDERIGVVADATTLLGHLVEAARQGYTSPLPFFAQAGWAWFDAKRPKKRKTAPKDPKKTAIDAYHKASGDFTPMGGDGEDQYVSLCFRGTDPMEADWDRFEELSRTLFDSWIAAGAKS